MKHGASRNPPRSWSWPVDYNTSRPAGRLTLCCAAAEELVVDSEVSHPWWVYFFVLLSASVECWRLKLFRESGQLDTIPVTCTFTAGTYTGGISVFLTSGSYRGSVTREGHGHNGVHHGTLERVQGKIEYLPLVPRVETSTLPCECQTHTESSLCCNGGPHTPSRPITEALRRVRAGHGEILPVCRFVSSLVSPAGLALQKAVYTCSLDL